MFLRSRMEGERAAATACPDANDLAAYAEHRLPAPARLAIERHILEPCAECHDLLATLLTAAVPEAMGHRAFRRTFRGTWQWLAAAAVLLVAAMLGAVLWLSRGATATDPEARLVATARALVAASPELFLDFTPLSADERLAAGGGDLRGNRLRVKEPVGIVASTRPAFTWEPVSGAAEYEVSLRDADGHLLFTARATGPSLPFPDDQPELSAGATFHLAVLADGVGRSKGDRRFRTASAQQRELLVAAGAAIERTVPAELRQLVLAHFCLRQQFYVEARAAAQASVAAHPDDRLGLETLFHALVQLGEAAADGVRKRLLALHVGG
ncbi:MAG TPA: hypothetical protein VK348_08350 [Planctomycetota bacterium]|nr:hypothetical protein [Planctomycetota bacterium]